MSQPNLGTLMPCGPRHFRDGELPFIRLSGRAVNKAPVVLRRRAAHLWR